MRKKIERLFLVCALLVAVICPSFQVQAAEVAKSTDSTVQATFDERTITVSSAQDATFKLSITVTGDTSTTSWKSEELSINSGGTITYNLENLVPSYSSPDIKLTSVSIEEVVDEDSRATAKVFLFWICFWTLYAVVMIIYLNWPISTSNYRPH